MIFLKINYSSNIQTHNFRTFFILKWYVMKLWFFTYSINRVWATAFDIRCITLYWVVG